MVQQLAAVSQPAVIGDRGVAAETETGLCLTKLSTVQRGEAEPDPDLPEDQRIRFRIGVNLGDVIIEGDDIYGDVVVSLGAV